MREGEYLACLNSTLHDIVKSTKQIFNMFSMGIQACVMAPSDYDPCLFMVNLLFCVIYVNGYLLFAKEDNYIDALAENFFDNKLEIEYEDQSLMASLLCILLRLVPVVTKLSCSQWLITSIVSWCLPA